MCIRDRIRRFNAIAASCRNKYSIPPQSDDVKPNQNRKVFPPRKNTNFRKNRVDFCVPMYYNNDCLKRAVCSSCNKRVSRFYNMSLRLRSSVYGGVPEWPKGTDCKSAASCFGGSNPPSSTRKRTLRLQSPFFNKINPMGICETALWAVKCLRMFIKRKTAGLRNHLAQQLRVFQHGARAQVVLVERPAIVVRYEERRLQGFEQCFFANVGIGIVDEHA